MTDEPQPIDSNLYVSSKEGERSSAAMENEYRERLSPGAYVAWVIVLLVTIGMVILTAVATTMIAEQPVNEASAVDKLALIFNPGDKVIHLMLGIRVRHLKRGSGTICLLDRSLHKCFHVQFDDGEMHRYSAIEAAFKLCPVDPLTDEYIDDSSLGAVESVGVPQGAPTKPDMSGRQLRNQSKDESGEMTVKTKGLGGWQ